MNESHRVIPSRPNESHRVSAPALHSKSAVPLSHSVSATSDTSDTAAKAAAKASKPHDRGSPSVVSPRLLNLRQAAQYVGVSFWSVRDWVLAGLVPVVALPPLRAREGERQRSTLRRVLVDREDLDRFIDSRKTRDLQSRARGVNAPNTRAVVPALCPDSSRVKGAPCAD